MKVHLKIIEGKDIPIMDVGGTCDGYCKIFFGKQKAQTRIIDNTLKPHWRQEFSFDVVDIKSDFLFIQLYDHDTIGKDEIISDLSIKLDELKPGEIIEKWFSMNPIVKKTTPKIRLIIHLSQENDAKFVNNPFKIFVTNIRVMTVKDVEAGEYTVSLGYKENLMLETRKSKDLIWQEEFTLAMRQDEPVLLINLNKGKNIISSLKLFTGGEEGQIEKKWHQMKDKGSIRLAIQITQFGVKPFQNEKFDDEFPPPTELTAYFRILEGKNLTPMDSNGKNDAYCTVVNLTKPKIIKKTQILYESIDPKWNYFINIKVYDYETDVIRISCYDYDLIGSNDLIGYADLYVNKMGDGEIINKCITIRNKEGYQQGELYIMYQICSVGWTPFKEDNIRYFQHINIHIMDGYDIPNTDLIGKTDPYVRIKLSDQEFTQKTRVINNTLNPCWDTTITLYSFSKNNSIQIELRDEATGKDPLIGTKNIDISDLNSEEIKEITEELIPAKGMKKGGKIHFYVQIKNKNPFKDFKFSKYIDTGKKTKRGNGNLDQLEKKPTTRPLTLFIKVVRAFNLKSCDSNGLSDPYCILQINNQKKTTSIIYECLNPKWDEYFIFDINSLNYDCLTITCMDYDLLSTDDLIGTTQIPIKSLIFGKINELKLTLNDKDNIKTGELNILLHVAKLGDIPFEEKLWNQKVLNIRILEGNNLPNGYLYWIGSLDNEKENQFISTQKSESKWIEQRQIKYNFENDVLLKLYEHGKKEREIAQVRITYGLVSKTKIVDNTFNFADNMGIHLILELNEFGYPAFVGLPDLDINNEKLFLCQSLTLNVKIIEAKNIPSEKTEYYCRLYLLGIKPKEKIGEVRTKNAKKSPTPYWNEEYHFPVRSLGTDVLCISLKERGTMGKENSISSYYLNINSIPYGTIVNAWFKFTPEKGITRGGSVHIKYQLAGPGNYAFINKPFTVKSLYIKIIEAKEIKVKNFNALADPYCQMRMIGDRSFLNTETLTGTLSPVWDENFSFLITNYETDSFKLSLKDNSKFKDYEIGSIELRINQFEIGKVYIKWLSVQNKGKKTGLIKTIISVVEPGIEPFSGEKIEDKIDFPPCQNWQINIHLISAENLPSADSNGLSDPYCLFTILKTNISVKSRKIDKNLNPVWDDYFHIPFHSLNSDILRLEIIDWDRVGKHDKLCMIDFPLNNFEIGVIYTDKYTLIPLEGNNGGSKVNLKFQISPPQTKPFSNIKYIPDQLNVRIEDVFGMITKNPLKNPKLYFNLRLESDSNDGYNSMIKNELNSIIRESFEFIIMNQNNDKLIIEYRNEEDKNKVLRKSIIPLTNLRIGETEEKNISMEPNGSLHLFLQIDKKNEIPFKDKVFTPLSNPFMTFYIKIKSGRDIPVADNTGLSDPFCILELKDRKEKQKTFTKIQTLTPVWNQTFQFKILSYNTDVFILSLYDYDKYSKNDFLGTWQIKIRDIKPGVVEEKEIRAGGLISVKYHLAFPGDPAFITKPFETKTLNIKVIEAKGIQTSNVSGLADLYCQFYIPGDIEYSKTRVKNGTLSPSWNETFSFIIANYQTDILKFELKESGKDNNIGDINLELNKYQTGKIYKKWLEMKSKGKVTGLVKVEINLINTGEKSFNGEIIEEKKEFNPSENWEINIHLIKATKLPSADSNGLSDPYCLFKILNRDISVKSRRIDKTLNPIWDDYINIPIKSLNSDIIRLEINDWDRVGKDDKLCMRDFPINELIPGKIYHETYSLIPLAGNPGGSTVELSIQLTPPSIIPFTPSEYDITQLNVRIEKFSTNIPLKNPKLYVNLKLESDSDEGYLTDTKEDLNPIFNEDFDFIIMEQSTEKLIIECKNENDNTIVGKCIILLKDLEFGKTKEIQSSLEPSGNIHLFLQINKKGLKPFEDMKLTSHINPYTTFYIKIISGVNIPVADNTGLSDPFCILELKDRKEKKKTLIRKQTLTPVWNQTFQFKILSYNTDVFILSLYDYDKFSKNDFLGTWQIDIKDIKPGIVVDKEMQAGGKIHVKYQLACPNQPQWENIEQPLYHLNVKVIEAKEFPNNTGKTDPFVSLFYGDDLYPQRTKTLDNTLTPQWFESFHFSFVKLDEPLIIRLVDDNYLKNSEMAEINIIKTEKYEFNYIYDEWIKMTPLGSYKTGGKIRLELQFQNDNKAPFSGPKNPSFRLPVSETKMTFNIKIIKGFNIENANFTKDTYCKMEFIGFPETAQKTRIIENSSNPFWDEFHQFEITSLSNDFQISLCDSKNEIISVYIIKLSNCDFGIKKEETIIMSKYSSSVERGGTISVIYQIAKPCQEIFYSEKFEIDKITCYVQSFENAIQGEEYYCEVKTINTFKGQLSKVTNDNLIMEKFVILARKFQNETLEIILFKLEKKGKYKFSKEIKRIKYLIEELGEHEIDGIKFTLQMNEDPNTKYPEHPPVSFPKRYFHILLEDCFFKDDEYTKRFKDSYIKLSLNKKDKIKRYSEKTRIVYNEQNPKFRHIFHIPLFSLKDDIITIKIYEYKKSSKKEAICVIYLYINSDFKYGEVLSKNIVKSNCNITLTTHISEANQPSFANNPFKPLYLFVKFFEIELKNPEKLDISIQMKNDLYFTNKLYNSYKSKRNCFGGGIMKVPISNKDDTYLIDAIYSSSDKIYSSYEFETKDLEPYLIYRINKNGLRFWAQIVNESDKDSFANKNFYNYYNQLPTERYMVYIEVIEFTNIYGIDSDNVELSYSISFGDQRFISRKFYILEKVIFNDEFKFEAKNLEQKLHLEVKINKDKKLDYDIDLTSHDFGEVVEEEYSIYNNSDFTSLRAKIKWQVTEPVQPRWDNKIVKINSLNLHIGKYASMKNNYEFWRIIFDNIIQQTNITPCGAFNQTFSFILTNQTKIIFQQYLLDENNFPYENQKIPINFLDLKDEKSFCLSEDLQCLIEIVPYKSLPFQGKSFPLYFTPKSIMSIAILLISGNNIDYSKNLYALFKFKDRTFLNEKSMKLKKDEQISWNQYFNFDIKSYKDDILEIYLMNDKSEIGRKEIGVSSIINNEHRNCYFGDGYIKLKMQIVPPNVIPFSDFKLEVEQVYIQFLYGENIKTGDLYCQCKLVNDLTWIKTKIIKNCQNPQWNQILQLPICNYSDYAEIEVNSSGLLGSTKLGNFKIGIEELSNEIEKKTIQLNQGIVHFLIAKGKNLESLFSNYREKDNIITAEKATLAVKINDINYSIDEFSRSSTYCLLNLGDQQQKTRCIDFNNYPSWNQLFYFNVPSYSTSELDIRIMNKLSKDSVIRRINLPIHKFSCGNVESKIEGCLNFTTHLIEPGKNSFESNPFKVNKKIVKLENFENNKDLYCMIQLKGDEYWRYTQTNKFSDFFIFEYIDQSSLVIKSIKEDNSSQETSLDINEYELNKEYIINISSCKYKITFLDEIKFIDPPSILTFNLCIINIPEIRKEKWVLWIIEVNNKSTGYSYDGNFDKYFSFPVNSLLSDEYNITLYREEKGKKKEIGKGLIFISNYKIGLISEGSINLKKFKMNFKAHISLPNKSPFVKEIYNPLIMHVCAIEAFNVPKTDSYVMCRLERDQSGISSNYVEKTTNPQWYEFIEFVITDENEDLIVEIWNYIGKKDKKICGTKLNMKKYLNGEIHFEWIKMDKIYLNIALQVKREGENFMTMEDINKYIISSIPAIN